MSNFINRVLVAVVGLPVVLGAVWAGGWWLFALIAIGSVVAVHEFVTMARPLAPLAPAVYVGVLLAELGAERGRVVWMLGGFLTCFLLAFILNTMAKTRPPATAAIGVTVMGAAWIGFGLGSIILLRRLHTEPQLISFTLLLVVFAADTFAYFGGRLFGRHKMASTLSPGKTWEGFVVGCLFGIFVAFVALYQDRDHYLAIWEAVVLGVVVVLVAVAGDLFESMLKRDMQVKDTGRLLGGHGGVLDRVDALLFAAPAAYFLVRAFGYL
ncbi:MAG: CDP-archaeol synthase [Actinomycetota bacterium]